MNVVPNMPTAENAKPISVAAGTASNAHQECTVPTRQATIRNAVAYRPPRISDQAISPTATSRGPSGVASTESYSLANLSLKNTLNVESNTAPFIAEAASSAGATKSAYGTTRPPSVVTVLISAPRPIPSENR